MPTPDFIRRIRAVIGHDLLLALCVNLVVIEPAGRVLVVKRQDGDWALPGGIMEPGESVTQAALRELNEETGVVGAIKRLTGLYSDPRTNLHTYANGDQLHAVVATFLCASDRADIDLPDQDEIVDGEFVPVDSAMDLLAQRYRPRLLDALDQRSSCWVT